MKKLKKKGKKKVKKKPKIKSYHKVFLERKK